MSSRDLRAIVEFAKQQDAALRRARSALRAALADLDSIIDDEEAPENGSEPAEPTERPTARREGISDEVAEAIVAEEYARGTKLKEIGAMVGRSESWVDRRRAKLGLAKRRPGRMPRVTDAQIRRMLKMRRAGASMGSIAEAVGCSLATVSVYLNRHGQGGHRVQRNG